MPYRAGQIAALRSTISAWMRLAIFEAMDREEQDARTSPRTTRGGCGSWSTSWMRSGQIDGLKDALARLRKFGGRCVLGFQSLAQVSSTYGQGDAHTIVENCGNTLILRCSASEGGGTARFASQLIGDREVLRTTVSRSRRLTEFGGSISTASTQCGVRGAALANRTAAGSDGLSQARVGSAMGARMPRCQAGVESTPSDVDSQAAAAGTSEMTRGRATMREGNAHE